MTSASGGLAAGPAAVAATQAAAAAAMAAPTTLSHWDLIWKIPIGAGTWVSVFVAGEELNKTNFLGELSTPLSDFDTSFL